MGGGGGGERKEVGVEHQGIIHVLYKGGRSVRGVGGAEGWTVGHPTLYLN
jgi:hypothetical protein